jgi:hypothetical protein
MSDTDDRQQPEIEEPALPRALLDAYVPPQPPSDLVDRIMARIEATAAESTPEALATRPRRRAWYAVAAVAAVAVAIGLVLVLRPAPRAAAIEGEVTATAPRHVPLGERADVLLDPGATIAFSVEPDGRCHVVQSRGTALYSVRRGAAFVVSTPAGRVSVLGTRFSVEVRDMRASLAKNASLAATAAVLVTVALYEGRLLFENEHGRVAMAEGAVASARPGEAPTLTSPAEPSLDVEEPTPRVRRFKTPEAREALRQAIETARRETTSRTTDHDRQAAHVPSVAADGGSQEEVESRQAITKKYIRETIVEIVPLLAECYEATLEQHPEAVGRVRVRFNIVGAEDVGGLVETAEIEEADESMSGYPDFDECLVQTILSLQFAPPEGDGELVVSFPFFFDPADDDSSDTAPEEGRR